MCAGSLDFSRAGERYTKVVISSYAAGRSQMSLAAILCLARIEILSVARGWWNMGDILQRHLPRVSNPGGSAMGATVNKSNWQSGASRRKFSRLLITKQFKSLASRWISGLSCWSDWHVLSIGSAWASRWIETFLRQPQSCRTSRAKHRHGFSVCVHEVMSLDAARGVKTWYVDALHNYPVSYRRDHWFVGRRCRHDRIGEWRSGLRGLGAATAPHWHTAIALAPSLTVRSMLHPA